LIIAGYNLDMQQTQAQRLLKHVKLEGQGDMYPLQLSGGEQQRVGVARALSKTPFLILADEPTGNLDYEIAEEIMRILHFINSQGTTIVMVTHNRSLLQRFKRKVFYLDHGTLQAYVWPD
jgi:cell division transport system ATP-binding protein